MCPNIGLHFKGDEIAHRIPLPDQIANPGRRDVQVSDFLKIKFMPGDMDKTVYLRIILKRGGQDFREFRGRSLKSGARHHNEIAEREEVLKFLPRLNLHEGIPAQDEGKAISVSFTKIVKGVDGVRLSRS